MFGLKEIRAALALVSGAVHRTPLLSASSIGRTTRVRLHLKCENFQKTGSFKARGALNKVMNLPEADREKGLVTVSAGNHAQAVAWAASRVEVPCVVVMPSDAPRSKLDAVRGYGAEVILHDNRDTLFDRLREVERERGATFVHPFDDPVVLAGAGTAGLEIVEDLPEVDAVIVPIGGGGLMSGVITAVKELNPRVRTVGVELEEGPGLAPAIEAGKPVPVSRPYASLADGMTPPFVGALPLAVAGRYLDQLVTVTEREIRDAMKLLLTRGKLYVEGAGAAATAAVLAGKVELPEDALAVALVSGGNVDPERLFGIFDESRGSTT